MMQKKRIAIIGTGALGKSVTKHFFGENEVHCFGRREEFWGEKKTENITNYLGQFKIYDVIFISVTDSSINDIVALIKPHITEKQWLLHSSGSISTNVFDSLKNPSGVIHFLQTFNSKSYQQRNPFKGISATFVGDENMYEWLKTLANALQIKFLKVSDQLKKQLHLAAVFVCNFQHVLFDSAIRISGLNEKDLKEFLKPLIQNTLDEIFENGVISTLSGPVKRKDFGIIEQHKAMLATQPDLKQVYEILTSYLNAQLNKEE